MEFHVCDLSNGMSFENKDGSLKCPNPKCGVGKEFIKVMGKKFDHHHECKKCGITEADFYHYGY